MNTYDEVISLTQKMVEIISVNGEEEALGNFLFDYCKSNGLEVEKRFCTEKRFNVMISYPPKKKEYALLFHGHYDTVPPLDMEDPFTAKIEDGYIRGRGTVDQKGGLAASIVALISAAEQNIPFTKGVCIAAVIDEESEHRGSMKLVEDKVKADCAIVTEPTHLNAVLGCKGTLPVKITVKGKASHGCRPWLGVNAVQQALPILDRLFTSSFEKKDFGPGLGILHNSINVGVVKAGSAYNNVPDLCEISLDCRIIPGESNESMIQFLNDLIAEEKKQNSTLEASASIGRPDWNWKPIEQRGLRSSLTPMSDPIVKKLSDSHYQVTKQQVGTYITDGYTDMDFLINDLSIPTIVYGPGNPRLCHTAEETISIKELATAQKVYQDLILTCCT